MERSNSVDLLDVLIFDSGRSVVVFGADLRFGFWFGMMELNLGVGFCVFCYFFFL